jgi:hypothetical protein
VRAQAESLGWRMPARLAVLKARPPDGDAGRWARDLASRCPPEVLVLAGKGQDSSGSVTAVAPRLCASDRIASNASSRTEEAISRLAQSARGVSSLSQTAGPSCC